MTSELINYTDPSVIATLKNTVAVGATDAEFQMFVGLCRSTGLNPFKKEVWFVKSKDYVNKEGKKVEGQVQIMTGINGFYEIANKNPNFDGIENTYGPDETIKVSSDLTILAPSWVETKVYRKDRSRPQMFRAYWREYAKELLSYHKKPTIWAKMPSVMLTKCADSMALRKAFPQELNGLYTAEEMPLEFSKPKSLDPLEGDWHELHNIPKPLPDDQLETYVITYSPDAEANGLMLCELEPEFYEGLNKDTSKIFDERDLLQMRQYYARFLRKTHLTKAEQAEKLAAKRAAATVVEVQA